MSMDLEPVVGPELDQPEPADVADDDREGCELIDGVWVPKHTTPPFDPDLDDRDGCELIDGVWVEKPMSNFSAAVEMNIGFALKGHVRANRLGFVLASSTRYQLFPAQSDRVRKPDVSVIRFGRLPDDQLPRGRVRIAPDIAVEVISPTDTAEGIETKVDEYLRAGVRLVWVVYIPTRNVWAYKPDGTARLYRQADTLDAADVLPGFAVPVAEVFEGLAPVTPVGAGPGPAGAAAAPPPAP